MISADVQRVKLEARERSLEDYKLKCQELRAENLALKDDSDKQEHDSQLVLKFLRDDAERKDELIESLKKTINQQRELFAAQREDERRAAAEELASVRQELTAREAKLSRELSEARRACGCRSSRSRSRIWSARWSRESWSARACARTTSCARQSERKFLEEKNRLQKGTSRCWRR